MKKIIVIGAGSRGTCYSELAAKTIGGFEIVAVAEPIDTRRNYIRDTFGVPENMCHTSWEDLLSRPKFADLVIIATMDRDHLAPALAAIDKGYDLLLEKPMGATPEECRVIERAASTKGVFVLVCHVLRFTPFFVALKSFIDSGRIGKVIHIQHAECVGNIHQSHSFVRGNWKNSEESTPMIVQKTCHDIDILQWLLGKECSRVHSFGSLTYFKEENAPEGAPTHCIDGCPYAKDCFYNAEKIYKGFPKSHWFVRAITQTKTPTDDDIDNALHGDYGRCVFRCDNNVVDHQTVNLEFEDGETISFTMCAFNKGSRNMKIMGSAGEVTANMGSDHLLFYDFASEKTEKILLSEVIADESINGGHGGGGAGIIAALKAYLDGNYTGNSICSIERTCKNHLIAFAAEESRLSGTVVDMKEFYSRF